MSRDKQMGPSQRQLRVGEQVRHNIVETLQRGHFHNEILMNEASAVTVTEVRLSPDLKNATAYIMTLGGQNLDEILKALNDVAPYFQKEIGSKLDLRFTPRVRFVTDDSFAAASRIDEILNNIS